MGPVAENFIAGARTFTKLLQVHPVITSQSGNPEKINLMKSTGEDPNNEKYGINLASLGIYIP